MARSRNRPLQVLTMCEDCGSLSPLVFPDESTANIACLSGGKLRLYNVWKKAQR